MKLKLSFICFFSIICGVVYAQSVNNKPFPFGVNLAGADFGENMPGVFDKDYTYPTAADLDYFKTNGLTLVRLPFKWERIQPFLGAPLDKTELERLKNVVSLAEERNIWILLDMHNYCRRKEKGDYLIIGDEKLPATSVANAWKQLAKELKDYKNIWGYGLMNEPHDMPTEKSWFNIAQNIIDQIRLEDTRTTIVVAGDSWSSAERWAVFSDHLKYLKDPSDNLIYEAHVYFDHDGSGSYKHSYKKEKADEFIGISKTMPFVEWLKKNNKRGFIGEYGVPDNDPRWLITLDKMLAYLQKNGVNGTYWAAGPWWGDHFMAVQPKAGKDQPQMKVLKKYLFAN
jgi:endoglucanase